MSKIKQNPVTEEFLRKLRAIYKYDPLTGVFTFLKKRGSKPVGSIAGAVNKSGYVQISIDHTIYYAHRLAWVYMTGEWPNNLIDHKDRNKANNKWDNLRDVTAGENVHNKPPHNKNTSGTAGVTFDKKSGKWYAKITVNYKQIGLGHYKDIEDAVNARKMAEVFYGLDEYMYMTSFKAEHMEGEVVDWEINCVKEDK